MVYSMTGFGADEATINNIRFRIELRTLNSKGLDLSIKLPSSLRILESGIRQSLSSLVRGKVECQISEANGEKSSDAVINIALLQIYFDQLSDFASQNKLSTDAVLPALLQMPGILTEASPEVKESVEEELLALLEQAKDQLNKFRINEGEALEKDLQNRLDTLKSLLQAIAPFEQARVPKIKARLAKELEQLTQDLQAEPGRLEMEMIFYVEKLDISEEKVRLQAHCDYFEQIMGDETSFEKGKKLGFITQEMGREVNTIGSKANDADIQQYVVMMKDEIEKIKEQVSNIL